MTELRDMPLAVLTRFTHATAARKCADAGCAALRVQAQWRERFAEELMVIVPWAEPLHRGDLPTGGEGAQRGRYAWNAEHNGADRPQRYPIALLQEVRLAQPRGKGTSTARGKAANAARTSSPPFAEWAERDAATTLRVVSFAEVGASSWSFAALKRARTIQSFRVPRRRRRARRGSATRRSAHSAAERARVV